MPWQIIVLNNGVQVAIAIILLITTFLAYSISVKSRDFRWLLLQVAIASLAFSAVLGAFDNFVSNDLILLSKHALFMTSGVLSGAALLLKDYFKNFRKEE